MPTNTHLSAAIPSMISLMTEHEAPWTTSFTVRYRKRIWKAIGRVALNRTWLSSREKGDA